MLTPNNSNSITWGCDICGRIRPDSKISVAEIAIKNFPNSYRNIKYCNDMLPCYSGVQKLRAEVESSSSTIKQAKNMTDQERRVKLINLICFFVLIENDNGIMSKSPDYLMEKYNRYLANGFYQEGGTIYGLDKYNTEKVRDYIKKWMQK